MDRLAAFFFWRAMLSVFEACFVAPTDTLTFFFFIVFLLRFQRTDRTFPFGN